MVQDQSLLSIAPPRDRFQTPLRKFDAVLQSVSEQQREINGRNRVFATFKFEQLEVIEATEPYDFPVATLEIGFSDADKTPWSALAASLRKLLPPDEQAGWKGILTGRKQTWEFAPATLRQPMRDPDTNETLKDDRGRDVWGDVEGNAWQIVAIEGYGEQTGNLTESILEMLEGKTEAQFNQVFFNAPQAVKQLSGFAEALTQATKDKLLPMLVEQGLVERDAEGVYSRK